MFKNNPDLFEALDNLLQGNDPVTAEFLRQRVSEVLAREFTLAADKDCSIQSIIDPRVVELFETLSSRAFMQIDAAARVRDHADGRNPTKDEVESGSDKKLSYLSSGTIGMSFLEMFSRSGDPHLHIHFLLFNLTYNLMRLEDPRCKGKPFFALEEQLILERITYIRETFEAGLREGMEALGYCFREHKGGWRLAHISDEDIAKVSKDKEEIEEKMEELRERYFKVLNKQARGKKLFNREVQLLKDLQTGRGQNKRLSEKNLQYLAHIETREKKNPISLPQIRKNTEARIGTDRMIEIIRQSLPAQPEPELEGFSKELQDAIGMAKGQYDMQLYRSEVILNQPWSLSDVRPAFPYILPTPPKPEEEPEKEAEVIERMNQIFQKFLHDLHFRQRQLERYKRDKDLQKKVKRFIERNYHKASDPDTIRGILLFSELVGGIVTDPRTLINVTEPSKIAFKSPMHPALAEFTPNQQILIGHLSERICTVIHPDPKRDKSIIVPDHTPRVIDVKKLFGLDQALKKPVKGLGPSEGPRPQ